MSENHGLDTDKQVFCYEQEFYPLSNFSAFVIEWAGLRFHTSEAVYHFEKFNYPHPGLGAALKIQRDILWASSAHEAFKIAERNRALRRPDWDQGLAQMQPRVIIMEQILIAKVQQHEYVRRKLLETGTRQIVENSWCDDFWGWGPNRDGQNILGKLWMRIRGDFTRIRAEPHGEER